ncbi:transporter substrate-binding domain-containing protein [Homoserinibacter sp. GY 40078]|uniref:transporter substrate-binding domain-containing protein n=1 Tax=Homoserinibacter sp. GY 40078 TaxID=2603275 RepID=UPI0011C705E0|nr:transporter substrate-binding domain-containing protein [Homoserinibacter sp. GY 40078]TXK16971.1 transporter substrate-binding domain-containing protein [Homoserinibacter sp. GY 40078]
MTKRTTRRGILAGATALVAASALLTGCTAAGGDTAAGGSTLDDILDSGKLTVGMTLQFEPQMYIDDDGNPAGYDVELLDLMAADLGVDLDIQDQEFEALIPGLIADQFDMISVGLVNTPERAKTVWFSDPYVPYNQVLLGNADLPADTTIADLDTEGTVITVLTGSTAAELAKRSFQKATITELDQDAALLEVSSGRAAASIVEEYLAGPYVDANPDTVHLLNSGEAFATQFGAYALPYGDTEWKTWVDNWLAYRTADGTLDALYRKWIEPTL